MLLRKRLELREKVVNSVEALQALVGDLREALRRREEELAARQAELDQAAGAVAERQRTLEGLARALDHEQEELRALLAAVEQERANLAERARALAEQEAAWRQRAAAGAPRVVNHTVIPVAAEADGGAEAILVRIIGPGGELQSVPAEVRFGEGAL